MFVDQVLSQSWVNDAKHEYNDRVLGIEADAGECMQECCRRDVKNQVYSAKMNAQLKVFDPSTQAMRIRDMSLAPESPGNAIDQSAEQDKPPSSPRATSTTPDDRVPAAEQREVDQLRQQRMQAMLRRRRNTMAAVDAGYGAYRDVTATEAQEIAAEAPAAVVHLWEAGFGADLDELLTRLALRHPGTRAVRAPLARSGAWLRQLRRPAEPLLLATHHGRTVGVMPVAEIAALAEGDGGGAGGESDVSSDFGDSDGEVSLESAVEGWLRCLGVLRAKPPACTAGTGPASAAAADSSDEEGGAAEEGDEWATPCALCGRTYPHTHKRAVRQGGAAGDTGSDDD